MTLEQIFNGPPNDYKWRELGKYLMADRLQTGTGLRLENSGTQGKTLSLVKEKQFKRPQQPPFSVLTIREGAPGDYIMTLQEGWVYERHSAVASDGVQYHEVNISGSPMSARPRPEVTMTDGDYLQVKYETDSEGFINTTPILEVVAAESTSTHHQPPSGEGLGSSGTYYVTVLQFTLDSGAPVITYHQQSDIEHYRLPTFQNLGGERYIHKEWNGSFDRYTFKTLEQFEPVGRDYGKVIVDAADEFNEDTILFSAIAERATNPQVNVNDDLAGTVTIEGNGVDGSIRFEDCSNNEIITLNWVDGLITTNNTATIQIPGCPSPGT